MKNLFITAMIVCFGYSTPLFANEVPRWEFTGSSSSFLSYIDSGDDEENETEFDTGAHFYYFINPNFEVGAHFYLLYQSPSKGNSSTVFRIVPAITYNFSDATLSSYFVRGGAGVSGFDSPTNRSYLALGFMGTFGKRVPISSSVTWTPEFSIGGHTRATDGDRYWPASTAYALVLFQFSVLL